MREQPVLLRRQGKSLRQIKQILGPVSNTTLHDALRGEPPPGRTAVPTPRMHSGRRLARSARKAMTTHRRGDRVVFMNSEGRQED